MGEQLSCTGVLPQAKKQVITNITLTKVANGYAVSGYCLQTYVFSSLREAISFIEKTIGNEIV
jgi:hypothetical protein